MPASSRHRPRIARGLPARGALWAALVWVAGLGMAHAASFTAELDRSTIYEGEEAGLSLTVHGGRAAAAPAPPAVTNLTFEPAGRSSQMTVINGRVSSAEIHSFRVQATQPGDYVIPPIRVVIDGREHTSQALRLRVQASQGERAQGGAFLRLVAPKTNVFVGEVLPVEIQLYYQMAPRIEAPQLAQEGFTLGKLVQGREGQVVLGGRPHGQLLFHTTVSAARAGLLTLGPATLRAAVPNPRAGRSIFGDPFEYVKVMLRSATVELMVAPLPTNGVPPDFNGAVGQYRMAVRISTNAVAVGDPITLTVDLTGRGAIESLKLNPLDQASGFKTYAPVTQVQAADETGSQGTKTFEQIIVPETTALKEIPRLTFSYFDPEAKAYRTLSHPATPLTVRPGATVATRPTLADAAAEPERPPEASTDIVHIKPRPGVAGQIQAPLVTQPWFLLLQAVPLGAWLGLTLWRRHQDRLARDPRRRRRQEVARIVRDGLDRLPRLAAAGDAEAFFATVVRLLQEALGARLDLPASAITEAVVDERLAPAGLDPALLQSLHDLFQRCNAARYAPGRTGAELGALIPKVESAVQQLQTVPHHG